eukprot:8724662-Pyramimonas_sp.AAC.1
MPLSPLVLLFAFAQSECSRVASAAVLRTVQGVDAVRHAVEVLHGVHDGGEAQAEVPGGLRGRL